MIDSSQRRARALAATWGCWTHPRRLRAGDIASAVERRRSERLWTPVAGLHAWWRTTCRRFRPAHPGWPGRNGGAGARYSGRTASGCAVRLPGYGRDARRGRRGDHRFRRAAGRDHCPWHSMCHAPRIHRTASHLYGRNQSARALAANVGRGACLCQQPVDVAGPGQRRRNSHRVGWACRIKNRRRDGGGEGSGCAITIAAGRALVGAAEPPTSEAKP